MNIKLGVIGGSGLYNISELNIIDEMDIDTPFGKPSDKILIGNFGNDAENIAFIPRHGRGHKFLPTEVNSRANIYALKSLGLSRILSISAVGSLKKEIKPLDLVIPDQIIDRTKGNRASTFFGNGIVGHVSFGNPFCPELSKILYKTILELGYTVHKNETIVCMEGPQFSTKAESNLYRSWGAGIIGMTALPEAKLAREAEMCYTILALSTDYDCWYDEEEAVNATMVAENMKKNIEKAQNVIKNIVKNIDEKFLCDCNKAAEFAIMTEQSLIPVDIKEKLKLFYGKYFK